MRPVPGAARPLSPPAGVPGALAVVVHQRPRLVGLAHVGVGLASGVADGLPLQLAGDLRLRARTLALVREC